MAPACLQRSLSAALLPRLPVQPQQHAVHCGMRLLENLPLRFTPCLLVPGRYLVGSILQRRLHCGVQ